VHYISGGNVSEGQEIQPAHCFVIGSIHGSHHLLPINVYVLSDWYVMKFYCFNVDTERFSYANALFFSGQFLIPDEKLSKIRDVCIFAVLHYVEPWFSATIPVVAPRVDLALV